MEGTSIDRPHLDFSRPGITVAVLFHLIIELTQFAEEVAALVIDNG